MCWHVACGSFKLDANAQTSACRACPDAWHPPMGIGPWHARAHNVECQNEYGARTLEGSGCSFGDNIEHLWADVRPWAYIMKRQTPAARRDLLDAGEIGGVPLCPRTLYPTSGTFSASSTTWINDAQCFSRVRERRSRKEARLPQQLQTWHTRSQQEIKRLLLAEAKLEHELDTSTAAATAPSASAEGQVGRVAAPVRPWQTVMLKRLHDAHVMHGGIQLQHGCA
jgi:Kyakuja-Dileera-Zisupton transposase